MNIIRLEEVASTNDIAMSGDYKHGTCVVANSQISGRGQRGNKWESKAGENLILSLVLKPTHILAAEQYQISMMAALAASDAIRSAGVDCCIKWPNDLYAGDKKIGGILIEHSLMGEMLTKSVVGVGLNVNQNQFSPNIPNPTSIKLERAGDYSIDLLLTAFLDSFEQRYGQTAEDLHRDYMERLWRREGFYRFRDDKELFFAAINGVDPLTGELTLKTQEGDLKRYWFKEVEFLL